MPSKALFPAESELSLALPGREPLAARVYGRKKPGAAKPLVLHFHGGSFVSGDLDSGACLARLMALSGAVVVSVAYPLAPQHPFPEAVEAGHAALEWLYKSRTKLGGNRARIFVAGEEAGGNIAAAVAMVARDRDHPPMAGQILVAPMLDPCNAMPSQRQAMGMETCCKWANGWQSYLRGPMDAEHPYAVPARANRLAGLPPALVLTGADDAMRDEAIAYAKRLEAAGIAVTSPVLAGGTGWPDALAEPPGECACEEAVQRHLRAFFEATVPVPS